MSSPIPWVLHPLPLVQAEPVRKARDTQLPLASCIEWTNQRLEKKKLKIPEPQRADKLEIPKTFYVLNQYHCDKFPRYKTYRFVFFLRISSKTTLHSLVFLLQKNII